MLDELMKELEDEYGFLFVDISDFEKLYGKAIQSTRITVLSKKKIRETVSKKTRENIERYFTVNMQKGDKEYIEGIAAKNLPGVNTATELSIFLNRLSTLENINFDYLTVLLKKSQVFIDATEKIFIPKKDEDSDVFINDPILLLLLEAYTNVIGIKLTTDGFEEEDIKVDKNLLDAYSQYMLEIRTIPLLSKEDEIKAARLTQQVKIPYMEKLDSYNQYLAAKENGVTFSKEEMKQAEITKKALDMLENDFRKKRNVLVRHNLRFAARIAKRFYGISDLEYLDLFQEANKGLVRAAETYNPDKGGSFCTYASYWILNYTVRALSQIGRSIRIPVHFAEKEVKIKLAEAELANKLGREPSLGELSQETGIAEDNLISIKQILQNTIPLSLDAVLNLSPEEVTTFGEHIDDPSHDIVQGVFDESFNSYLAQAILHSHVSRKSLYVVAQYNGVYTSNSGFDVEIDDESVTTDENCVETGRHYKKFGRSLDSLATELGISRQRVEQIRNKCYDMLKEAKTVRALASDSGLVSIDYTYVRPNPRILYYATEDDFNGVDLDFKTLPDVVTYALTDTFKPLNTEKEDKHILTFRSIVIGILKDGLYDGKNVSTASIATTLNLPVTEIRREYDTISKNPAYKDIKESIDTGLQKKLEQ